MRLKGFKLGLVILTVLVMCLGLSGLVYAEKGGKNKADTTKSRGDNRDNAKSGKSDRIGDGNSGQGDDLRQGKGKSDKNKLKKRWKKKCHEWRKHHRKQCLQREGVREESRDGSSRKKMLRKWKEFSPEQKAKIRERLRDLPPEKKDALHRRFAERRRHADDVASSEHPRRPGWWKDDKRCEELRKRFRMRRGKSGDVLNKKEHRDRGVRDHGQGEGRDGAGQGKGKGKGPRGK